MTAGATVDLAAALALLRPWIFATALAVARASGLVLISPLFTRLGLVGLLRGGVAMALAAPMAPVVFDGLQSGGIMTPLILTMLAAKELFVGLLLGLAFGVPFWAAEAAGAALDLQRGATASVLVDPSALSQSSVTGTAFVLVLLMIFVLAGGVGALVDALYRSYAAWPPVAFMPRLDGAAASWALALLDRVTGLGLILAAPIIVAMFLGDLSLAVVARFAPQLNVFDLSMALKNAIFVLLLPVYLIFLVDHMKRSLAPLASALETLQGFLR
jgi:type III secretion protein T